jgi:YD repeat-containing protein
MSKIKAVESSVTGEVAPAHLIGTDEHGRRIFADPGPEWGPIDESGQEVAVNYDGDGNWVEIDWPTRQSPTTYADVKSDKIA